MRLAVKHDERTLFELREISKEEMVRFKNAAAAAGAHPAGGTPVMFCADGGLELFPPRALGVEVFELTPLPE